MKAVTINWRPISSYFLKPIQQCFNVLFFVYGFGFLIRFGLGFYDSAELETLRPVVLVWNLTDPFLPQLHAEAGGGSSFAADAYRVVPLILSIVIWFVRPAVMDLMTRVRMALERRGAETLFAPRRLANDRKPLDPVHGSPAEERAAESGWKPFVLGQPANVRERGSSVAFPIKSDIQVIGGRYELIEELGCGRAVAVYKALDLRIGRVVALKMIIADDLSPEELRQQKEWFYREARTAGKMTHPGIVTVLDIAEDEAGHPYIVMEYVEGEPLERALSRRDVEEPLNLSQRMSIAIQLAKALDYAHRHGVVHRDIKPSNVLISDDCHAKIVDFGIAMVADPKANGNGQLPGTPAFVAPELLQDSAASARSDIFSLGVVLYWMFTSEIPFPGSTVTEITYNVAHTNPPPARQVNWALPEELDEVLRKCLAKNPADRYASAGMLAADLVALREGKPRAARPLQQSIEQTAVLYQMK